jgi:hypothetical protein
MFSLSGSNKLHPKRNISNTIDTKPHIYNDVGHIRIYKIN